MSLAANPISKFNLINSSIKTRNLNWTPAIATFSFTMDNQSELTTGRFYCSNNCNILGQGKLTISNIDNFNNCSCTAFFMSDYGGTNAAFNGVQNIKLRNLTLLGPSTINMTAAFSNSNFQVDTIDVYTNWKFNSSFNNGKVNKLFRLNAGASIEFNEGKMSAAPSSSINLAAGCELQINGTCTKPCYIQGHIFNFSTPAVYTSTVTYATIINSSSNASPAIPCANSSLLNPTNIPGMPAALGTLTGFSGGALPAARTLFWLGTTPIASKDNYQHWNNPANWSLSNGGVGGECPPTMHDSVIFPNGSLVRLDDSPISNAVCAGGAGISSYISNSHIFTCKSMIWQGSGDIYDSVPNVATFNTSAYPFTAATGVNELRIHGSLICSPTFSNNFHGNVVFAAWQAYPKIKTSNVSFNRWVIFRGISSNTKWTMMDTLKVDKFDCGNYEWYIINEWELQLHAGYLNTNGFGFKANAYAKYMNVMPSVLDIRNAKCFLTRAAGFRLETFYNQGIKGVDSVKAVPSHIIFTNPAPDANHIARFVGGGYKYDTLTFKGLNNSLANYIAVTTATYSANRITDTINRLIAEKSLVITTANANGSSYPVNKKSFVIKRADIATKQVTGTLFTYNAIQNNQAYFDSLYLYCDGQFNKSLRINKLLYYNTGHIYNHTDTTVFGNTAQWIIKSGCGSIGGGGYTSVKNGKFYKPVGGSGGMGGAITTTLSGTPITSSLVNSLNGVLLENCTAVPVVAGTAGESYSLTNSSDFGGNTSTSSTPGWVFNAKPIRNLLWVASTATTTADMWQDCNNWALCDNAGVQIAPAPNAPPFETDDVWFTEASFVSIGDTVKIDAGSAALFKTMRWTTITKNPVFKGDVTTSAFVFGSIYFSANMQTSNGATNYMQSAYTYRGTDPANVLDTKGKIFAGYAYFNGDANNTQWTLISDYNNQFDVPMIASPGCVSGVSIYTMYSTGLLRGKLVLNGNHFYCGTFISNSNKVRTLDITNSTMHVQRTIPYNPCFTLYSAPQAFYTQSNFLIRDSSNVMTVLTGVSSSTNPAARPAYTATSSIIMGEVNGGVCFTNGFYGAFSGGGKRYNLVHFVNGGGLYNSSGDTIMRLKVNATVDLGARYVTGGTGLAKNQQNTYIGAIYFLSNTTAGQVPTININRLPGSPYGRTLVVDSIIANGNVDILDSIHVRNQFKFGSGNTYNYRFAASKTCYLGNNCEFKPVGSSFVNTMNFNSTIAGTVARIRKDSGLVCVGYLNIRDVQAVGNGQSLPAFATAPQSTPIGPYTTTQAFYADTVWASSYYTGTASGPVGANPLPTSGRAVFSLDNTADISQSVLNRGWEVKNFGVAPSLTLTAITPSVICYGDSIKLTISGTGGLPFVFTYSLTGIGTVTVAANSVSDVTTYNPLTGSFTYEPYVKPTSTGSVSAAQIKVTRCFNDLGIGTGIKTFTVKPLPAAPITSVMPNTNQVCASQTFTLANISVPAGVSTTWYASQTSTTSINTSANTFSNNTSAVGNYTYYTVATSTNGCSSARNSVPIVRNPNPVLAVISNSNLCGYYSLGSATVTVNGGWNAGNTYLWQGSASTSSVSLNYATGTYTVKATDVNLCSNVSTFTIVNPSINAISIHNDQANCSLNNENYFFHFYRNIAANRLLLSISDDITGIGLGNTTTTVQIDASVQTLLGVPYLQRRFGVTPTNPELSTLRFYFTQTELTALSNKNILLGGAPVTINDLVVTKFSNDNMDFTGAAVLVPITTRGSIPSGLTSSSNILFVEVQVSSYSHFILHPITNSPLPIELLFFKVDCIKENVNFKWSTATEQNNEFFIVESSMDGFNWQNVLQVNGAGNSQTIHNYNYIIKNNGASYYRLKQIDYNHASVYSNIVDVNCDIATGKVYVFPNPNEGFFTIKIDKNFKNCEYTLYNMLGEKVLSGNIENKMNSVYISNIAEGLYLITISQNSEVIHSEKIKIQKNE